MLRAIFPVWPFALLMVLIGPKTTPAMAVDVSANYTTGDDVPVTSQGYTATGNTVSFSLNYAPTPGTILTVVKNTGHGHIEGEFTGLTNGAPVDLSFGGISYRFVAWYFGGDGYNDLVLLWRDTGLAAWGDNFRGQLGINTTSFQNRNAPAAVDQSGVLAGKTIVQVVRGGLHSLALCSDGSVAAWGSNNSGQLGDNTYFERRAPVAVNTDSGTSALFGKTVVALAAGGTHSLALCSDGSVAAWGYNFAGQLGDNSTTNRSAPVLVNIDGGTSALFGKTVVGLVAGHHHSVAVCSDGSVASWGYNDRGQLGDNSTTNRNGPVLVNTDSGTSALFGKTVVALAAGQAHSLALCSDGSVAAWGYNFAGQLGDNSTTDRSAPVMVNSDDGTSALFGKTVVALTAGEHHGLALCADGSVAAWGSNYSGQLGDNSTTIRHAPVLVNTDDGTSALFGKTVVSLAAGEFHSLALCSDGSVASWGNNSSGQLGDSSGTTRSAPVLVNTASGTSALADRVVSSLSVSGGFARHTLAVYAGTAEIAVEQLAGIELTDGVASVGFGTSSIAGGPVELTLSIRNTGSVDLIGLDVTLSGTDVGDFSVATSPVATLNAGGSTTLKLRFAPTTVGVKTAVLHIGSNDEDENPFDLVLTGSGIAALSAFYTTGAEVPLTTAGLTATGSTVDLSLNYAPTPGTTLTVVKNTGFGFIEGEFTGLANGAPVDLNFDGISYRFVAWYYGGDGNNDLVLLWRDTGLAAWGYTTGGLLRGDSNDRRRSAPVAVDQSGVLAGKTIVQVVKGGSHSLVLCSDGSVAAWGGNNWGQLGDNSTTYSYAPVLVNTDTGTSALFGKTVVALAAGESHSLALCSDGSVAAWGYNFQGRLGDNSTTERHAPVLVNTNSGISALSGKTVVALAAGESHSMALCSDGSVAAWGANSYGRLGDNSNTPRYAPVLVNTDYGTSALFGKAVVALEVGESHSLALCSDGSVAAWGKNNRGQLGDNSTTDRRAPVLVNTDNGTSALFGKTVVAVAAGEDHSVALCSDGSVTAWGYNNDGQLGDNSVTRRRAPVLVNTDSGNSALFGRTVVDIAAGGAHSLALCLDGGVVAWGANSYGQLGDNSTTDRHAPVLVNADSETSVLADRFVSSLGDSGGVADYSLAVYAGTAEISVEQLVGIELADGVASVDLGTVAIAGSAVELTLTIRNTGPVDLTGLDVTFSGTDVSDFSVIASPVAPVSSNGSTTFTLRFAPTVVGVKTAALHIASNDGDENPVDIALTGSGISTLTANYTTGEEVPLATQGLTAAGIDLELSLHHAPTPGTTLTVVENTGHSFIEGEFNGIANGASVDLSFGGISYPFVAWYYGGKGNNDLVLLWRNTGLAGWGANYRGQLGDNTAINGNAPVGVIQSGVLAGKTIVQVVRGENHSLALCSDGSVAAWGENRWGQLGDNTQFQRNVPVPVKADSGTSALFGKTVVALAAGYLHSLALCSDGSVAAWGYNDRGQLGDNSTTHRYAPVLVNTDSGTSALFGKTVVGVTAGRSHNLALCSDGSVAAWGLNAYGRLGDDSDTDRHVPVLVNTENGTSALFGKTVVSLTAGSSHSMALCSDGLVAAWGDNFEGTLGNNSTAFRYAPVLVNTDSGTSALFGKTVVALAAGERHSLALCSDGSVTAWGANPSGQLGDNTTTDRLAPVLVNTDNGTSALHGKSVIALSAGYLHSLALCSDGSVATWGYNDSGQLGDTTGTTRHAPVLVNTNEGTSVLAGRFVRSLSVSGPLASHSLVLYGADSSKPGALLYIGDDLDFDLSWVQPRHGESLKVLGLPPGLVFNDGPLPSITGTALGLGSNRVVTIQVIEDKKVVRSIPLILSVEPLPSASSYQLLLEDSGQPVGKLRVTINNPSKRSLDPTYSATFERLGGKRRTAKGSFAAGDSPQTVPIVFPAFRTSPAVNFDLIITDDADTVTAATNPESTVTGRGFRLMRPGRIPAGNPALTLTLPPNVAGDREATPAGIGYASGKITSKALVPLRGQLGDAQAFSTSLYLSHTDQAVVWLTPYKNKQSYLGGIIEIGDIASATRTTSDDGATNGLQWKREGDTKEKSYPDGFGPLALDATTSRWVPMNKAEALAQSLGLYYRAIDVSFLAPTGDIYPDQLSLRDNSSLLTISPEEAVAFKGKATGKTGLFAGTLGLAAPANRSAVKGVLLQEESFGTLVGQGVVKVPIAGPVRGAFQTVGIELKQTAGPGAYSYQLGDAVNIDLSFITLAPEETLKVIGLPKGLAYSDDPTPMIIGTALGYASTRGVIIQILNGKTIVQTIPLDLAIDPYAFAGEIEVLLEEGGLPVGKLKVKISNPTFRSPDPGYSATLERLGETRRRAKGSFTSTAAPQTVTIDFPALKSFPAVSFDLILADDSDLVAGTTNPASSVTARGFRLAKASRFPYGNPTLTMALPAVAASDGVTTPAGTGHATGKVTSKALAPVRGLLGDAQKFSSTLSLSQANQAVVWVTPYKNKESYLGGVIELGEVGAADRAASADSVSAGLKWKLEADPKAKAYPDGFGPLDLDTLSNRWYPQRNADALAQSLGLDFRAINVEYGAPTGDPLPTLLSLRNNSALLPLAPDDSVPFKGKAIGKTGTFNGRLRLPAPATNSPLSGVLLQDESNGNLIGLGLIKMPIDAPVRGSYQTSGVVLSN